MKDNNDKETTMKILGINDDVTICECCGKKNLKKTVVLENEGAISHYGVNCAARALCGSEKSGDRKIIESRARAISLANRWLAAGHAPKVVAMGIWNRFGYSTEVFRGQLLISTFATIELPAP